MNNTHITQTQIFDLVTKNKYEFDVNSKILSRCIDGRYTNDNLEPLAKPGADIGDLMSLFSLNNEQALGLSNDDIFDIFMKVLGEYSNVRIHTDEHCCHEKDEKKQCLGCGHFKQATIDPDAYGLSEEDVDFIFDKLVFLKSKGVKNDILEGEHLESGVVILNSQKYSIKPAFLENGKLLEVFVYHKTLDDKRRREYAKELNLALNNEKFDEEFLYEALTGVSDNQLFETVSRLAPDLPIYKVNISDEGEVEIEE